MNMRRRDLLKVAAVGAFQLNLKAKAANQSAPAKRKKRVIYFNDARHYYLYVFEPPMKLQDAWRPVDEVAGTTVNTFIYGVERGDGLFYPSKIGMRFGADIRPFDFAAYWRTWENMQSLIDRGLDPLKVLIDRAHAKGMDFFASLRMSAYGGMNKKLQVPEGGRGIAHPEIRDHQFAVLEELATQYNVEGVELDFAAAPGGMPPLLRAEDVTEFTPVITDYIRKISKMVRSRSGKPGQLGARVYPTEQMCQKQGLDVQTWLREGLIDYVAPMLYLEFKLDPDMPIDWLIQAAHAADVAVYGVLQPYVRDGSTGNSDPVFATPEMLRAASANYWDKGVDGLYAWSMPWPLGDAQRRVLAEIGDPELIKEQSKLYVLRARAKEATELGYDAALPLAIPSANPNKRYPIDFYIADDIEGLSDRIRQVTLKLKIDNLVSADRLTILLNGKSLERETCLREFGNNIGPYEGECLEFHLREVRPRKGKNVLEISLDGRPSGLGGGVSVKGFEILVEYGPYPSVLTWQPA